jgi:hypothetical protein
MDRVSLSGATLTASGWAVDSDTATAPVRVSVSVDGRAVPVAANRARSDIGRAFPSAGAMHGFTYAAAVGAGNHRVCAYALDTGGRGSTALGCRIIRYTSHLPIGAVDRASTSGGVLTVVGWTVDSDTPTVSARVHVYVDRSAVALTADLVRADIGRAMPAAGGAHGFTWSGPLGAGGHRLCVYAIDTAGQGNALLGCRMVTG